jgi:hypothetical protein
LDGGQNKNLIGEKNALVRFVIESNKQTKQKYCCRSFLSPFFLVSGRLNRLFFGRMPQKLEKGSQVVGIRQIATVHM